MIAMVPTFALGSQTESDGLLLNRACAPAPVVLVLFSSTGGQKMLGYVTIGTRDLPRAVKFYDAIAKELETPRLMEFETFIAWQKPDGPPGLAVTLPYDKKPATVGNGMMVALKANDPEQVKRLYDLALSMGGTDEGPPGDRGGGFYAAYFRDLDGNKLNAFCMTGG
jgi:catechol 2,3-dioxygenase-like lactoylglutathione lyase family enzyme